MYYLPSQQRTEYRLPAVFWSNRAQQWAIMRNTVAARNITIEHLEIDLTQLPRPCYFPGQRVVFRDSRGATHEGTIVRVGNYGCTYQDPSQEEYWYQWAYFGPLAYSYLIYISNIEGYEIFAEAILGVKKSKE